MVTYSHPPQLSLPLEVPQFLIIAVQYFFVTLKFSLHCTVNTLMSNAPVVSDAHGYFLRYSLRCCVHINVIFVNWLWNQLKINMEYSTLT